MIRKLVLLSLVVATCIACSEKKETLNTRIADLQDRRATDSLLLLLEDKAAQLAFASVQDTSAINKLSQYKTPEAAFALGQMYSAKAVAPLKTFLDDPLLVREAYEALGKCIVKADLPLLTSLTTTDTSALAGIAWGLYRAGVRGVTDSTSISKEISILSDKASGRTARLGAAHFFLRVPMRPDDKVGQALVAASTDEDPEIRMAIVSSLVRIPKHLSIDGITPAVDDKDYRVRVNVARALRSILWADAKPFYEKLLSDENPHVNVAAAEMLMNVPSDSNFLHQQAKTARNWRAQATLYQASLKFYKANNLDKDIKKIYANSTNDYQKAALLNTITDADFIFDQFKSSDVKVIKSTAASALADISSDLDKFKYIIADGDQGSIIPICGALLDSTRGFRKSLKDISFLEEAKNKLSLPRDYETYAPLEQAINYLKGLPPPQPLKNEYNHPIDWTVAATIAPDQHVMIETTKGEIVMRLFIKEAPGSVVNFVNLVNTGYFNNRFFHRVVPNFVAQVGCNRGDGFGSEDYSIRSEFSQRRYKTGSVGMASAGKDTEGTQWFITHSPTPHLDGKYTIFAEVVKGMDVVNKIEVGDKIIQAHLIEY